MFLSPRFFGSVFDLSNQPPIKLILLIHEHLFITNHLANKNELRAREQSSRPYHFRKTTNRIIKKNLTSQVRETLEISVNRKSNPLVMFILKQKSK